MTVTEHLPTSPDAKAAQLDAIERSGWGRPFELYQPHNFSFWVYALLVGVGTVSLLQSWADSARGHGATLVIAVLYFALYSLPFLAYIRHNDRYESEPAKLCAVGFVWGATAATFGLSIHANDALDSIYSKVFGFGWTGDWSPGFTGPFTEELAKAAGLVLIIAMAPRLVRTAYDGAVIGACIGLGFQVIEDIVYVVQDAGGHGGAISSDALNTLLTRSLTGLVSHVVYSAIAGMAVVWLWGRPDEPRRVGRGLLFFGAAIALHFGWNTMKAIGDRSGVWSAISPIVVTVADFTILFAGLRLAATREREWMRALLAPERDRGTISDDELEAVAGPRRARRTFARSAPDRAGRRQRRHVFDAITDLAEQIARGRGQETPDVEHARAELSRRRTASTAP